MARIAVAFWLMALGCAAGARAPAKPPPEGSRSTLSTEEPVDLLMRANGDFHMTYKAGRAREQATLGASRPYLALADEKLVLRYQGRTEERSVASARFNAVKAASHMPVAALGAILAQEDASALRELAGRDREVAPAITPAAFGDAEAPARAVVVASVDLLEAAASKMPS